MKMNKRVIGVICVMVSVILLFVACSSNSNEANNSDNENNKNKVNNAEKQNDANDEENENNSSKENSSEKEDNKSEESVLEITGMAIQQAGAPPDQYPEYWQYIEDYFNIDYKVDWVSWDGYMEKLQLIFASKELPEIVQLAELSDSATSQAIEAGMFTDIGSEFGDFSNYPNLGQINPLAWKLSQVNGKNYIVPNSRGIYNHPVGFLRGDWLEEFGMDIPVTIDEYTEYFLKIKETYPEVIPLATMVTKEAFVGAFGKGAIEPVYNDEGGLVHYFFTESYRDYLDWHRNLYENDCMAKEYNLISNSQSEEMFASGRTGYYGRNFYHWKRVEIEAQKTDENAKVVTPLYAIGEDGRYGAYIDRGFWGGLAVSSEVPKDKLGRILDFFEQGADPENYNLIYYGREGVHWNYDENNEVKFTEKGENEVNYTFSTAFAKATNIYAKVNSPYASFEENQKARELVKQIDYASEQYTDFAILPFTAISSSEWGNAWAMVEDDFMEKSTKFVMGLMTYEEFEKYQKEIAATKDMKKAFLDLSDKFVGLGFSPDNKPVGQ